MKIENEMDINLNEIKNYLEGKTDKLRSEVIREWLTDPENEAQARQLLGEMWSNSSIKLTGNKPDFEEVLKRLHYRLNSQPNTETIPIAAQVSKSHKLYQLFSRAAAILIIPLILFTAYLYFRGGESSVLQKISMREIYTKPGTRTQLTLSDGTKVWLNDGTTLKYPEQFSGKERKVFVDGEAYFEVESNPGFPFIVENPMMNTVVTGTHFNVNAYAADKFFEATLLEGKIHLTNKTQNIELTPGQQVQFDGKTSTWERRLVKSSVSVSWIEGRLIIQNEKLETAIRKLSRWYNVEIDLSDQKLNELELTCTLENEKVEQCMDLISQALPIRFEIKTEKEQNRTNQKIKIMMK